MWKVQNKRLAVEGKPSRIQILEFSDDRGSLLVPKNLRETEVLIGFARFHLIQLAFLPTDDRHIPSSTLCPQAASEAARPRGRKKFLRASL